MTCLLGLTPRPLFMPIRGAFPTIHTNLWNPVASYCHCVISPHLRIAPVPSLGPGGIGIGGLCRVAQPSDSGITRRPKIPIIFYCSGTIRAGRSCRSISRGRTSVFGPGSGGTPSRRTIAAGVIRLSERHVQSRIPDAAGRHCAGSGP